MKKLLLSLFGALFVLYAVAQNNDYLTFRTVDGAELSLPVDGLKITFDNLQLHAVAQGEKVDLNLSDMGLMFFSETSTAINRVESVVDDVSIVNGRLVINSANDVKVRIYTMDGRLIESDYLSRGVYLVNVNGRTYKLLSK